MNVDIRRIGLEEVEIVSDLLATNFMEDEGVIVLFKKNDPQYASKVKTWYVATLRLLIANKQWINGAYIDKELVGVSVVTHGTFRPSTFSILKWTLIVGWSCSFSTVIKSAKHDQHRKHAFTEENQYILEFIAVNVNDRGKGIGKKLFSSLHQEAKVNNASIWLETTKKQNIAIFEKNNYALIEEKSELAVTYYVMINNNKEV